MAAINADEPIRILVVVGSIDDEDNVKYVNASIKAGIQSWAQNLGALPQVDEALLRFDVQCQSSTDDTGSAPFTRLACKTSIVDVVVLINPTCFFVNQEIADLIVCPSSGRLVVYGGHSVDSRPNWCFQDGIFAVEDLQYVLNDKKVAATIHKTNARPSLTITCCKATQWKLTQDTSLVDINFVEPFQHKATDSFEGERSPTTKGLARFMQHLEDVMGEQVQGIFAQLEPPSNEGYLKLRHPCLYIFPSGNGDSAFFTVNGYNVLVNGGALSRPWFWRMVRHQDRVDCILATHLGSDSLTGINSFFLRKVQERQLKLPMDNTSVEYKNLARCLVSPEVGVFYMNTPTKFADIALRTGSDSVHDENEMNGDHTTTQQLNIKTADIVKDTLRLSKALGVEVNPLSRKEVPEPITLFYNNGIGKLEMYIVSPEEDSKDLTYVREKWGCNGKSINATGKTGVTLPSGEEGESLLSDLASICCLLVWHPVSPTEKIVRVLFPGNAPQTKVLEGLEKLKHLDFLSMPCPTQSILNGNKAKAKPKAAHTGASKPHHATTGKSTNHIAHAEKTTSHVMSTKSTSHATTTHKATNRATSATKSTHVATTKSTHASTTSKSTSHQSAAAKPSAAASKPAKTASGAAKKPAAPPSVKKAPAKKAEAASVRSKREADSFSKPADKRSKPEKPAASKAGSAGFKSKPGPVHAKAEARVKAKHISEKAAHNTATNAKTDGSKLSAKPSKVGQPSLKSPNRKTATTSGAKQGKGTPAKSKPGASNEKKSVSRPQSSPKTKEKPPVTPPEDLTDAFSKLTHENASSSNQNEVVSLSKRPSPEGQDEGGHSEFVEVEEKPLDDLKVDQGDLEKPAEVVTAAALDKPDVSSDYFNIAKLEEGEEVSKIQSEIDKNHNHKTLDGEVGLDAGDEQVVLSKLDDVDRGVIERLHGNAKQPEEDVKGIEEVDHGKVDFDVLQVEQHDDASVQQPDVVADHLLESDKDLSPREDLPVKEDALASDQVVDDVANQDHGDAIDEEEHKDDLEEEYKIVREEELAQLECALDKCKLQPDTPLEEEEPRSDPLENQEQVEGGGEDQLPADLNADAKDEIIQIVKFDDNKPIVISDDKQEEVKDDVVVISEDEHSQKEWHPTPYPSDPQSMITDTSPTSELQSYEGTTPSGEALDNERGYIEVLAPASREDTAMSDTPLSTGPSTPTEQFEEKEVSRDAPAESQVIHFNHVDYEMEKDEPAASSFEKEDIPLVDLAYSYSATSTTSKHALLESPVSTEYDSTYNVPSMGGSISAGMSNAAADPDLDQLKAADGFMKVDACSPLPERETDGMCQPVSGFYDDNGNKADDAWKSEIEGLAGQYQDAPIEAWSEGNNENPNVDDYVIQQAEISDDVMVPVCVNDDVIRQDHILDDVTAKVDDDVTEEVTDDVTAEVADEVTRQEVTDDVTAEFANDVTVQVADDVAGQVADDVAEQEVTDDVTAEFANDVTVQVADDVTVQVADDVTGQVADDVAVQVADDVTGQDGVIDKELGCCVKGDAAYDIITHDIIHDDDMIDREPMREDMMEENTDEIDLLVQDPISQDAFGGFIAEIDDNLHQDVDDDDQFKQEDAVKKDVPEDDLLQLDQAQVRDLLRSEDDLAQIRAVEESDNFYQEEQESEPLKPAFDVDWRSPVSSAMTEFDHDLGHLHAAQDNDGEEASYVYEVPSDQKAAMIKMSDEMYNLHIENNPSMDQANDAAASAYVQEAMSPLRGSCQPDFIASVNDAKDANDVYREEDSLKIDFAQGVQLQVAHGSPDSENQTLEPDNFTPESAEVDSENNECSAGAFNPRNYSFEPDSLNYGSMFAEPKTSPDICGNQLVDVGSNEQQWLSNTVPTDNNAPAATYNFGPNNPFAAELITSEGGATGDEDGRAPIRTPDPMMAPDRPMSSKMKKQPGSAGAKKGDQPSFYVDLSYIPHHVNKNHCGVDFFKRIRSKYYVISGFDASNDEPNSQVLEFLLEGKTTWDSPTTAPGYDDGNVTVIPTHNSTALHDWYQKQHRQLEAENIHLVASGSKVLMHNETIEACKIMF